MILTTRLKIWTLISHAFIIIGLGHGIATLGISEFFWLSTIFGSSHSSGEDGHVSLAILQLVAFMCLAGQIGIVTSIFVRSSFFNKWAHMGGLGLLWASVITYAYGIQNDNYAHLAVLSCLPFVYCTIKTFFGGHIRLLWQKIDARI
jgi:hypothetical protein